MECRDVAEHLSAFLDDELDPVASDEISRHLESCRECADLSARHGELSHSLKRGLEYHRAPDLLRSRVMRDVRTAARRDSTPMLRAAGAWGWLGAAAAVAVVAGGLWLTTSPPGGPGNDAIAREVVSGHIRSLMASHLTDVASTDQHTVKPWFSGKLDFSPPVTDFAEAGYPLSGGRLDYLEGRPVAALVYLHRKHVINVFVWPTAGAREGITPAVTLQGYHVIRITHADMDYRVVSDLNAEELMAFARMLNEPSARP